MTSLTPQTTGTQLGSRNPFASLLSAQNTGTSNGSSSQTNARALSPPRIGHSSSERSDGKPSELDVTPPSPPPKREGALNTPTNSTDATASISRQLSSASNQPTGPYNPPAGPPPRLPPRNADTSTDSARATGSTSNQHRSSTLDMLQEDLPPAYTPGPNSREGEQTVELGPIRPFMDDRRPPRPRPQPAPQQGNLFGVSLSGSPSYGHYRRGSRNRNRNEPSLSRLLGNMLIDYITTPREEERRQGSAPGSFGQYNSSQPSRPSQLSQPSMRSAPSAPRGGSSSWSQYPGMTRSVTPPPPSSLPPNDGKPTARPTPGHPLISNGKVLVYPIGYECRKCHNRGFRPGHRSTFDDTPRALAPGDPSHPCKRCWRHYSRIYDATLARLDWTEAMDTNFQRPISDASFMPPSNSISTSNPSLSNNNLSRGPINAASLQPQSTGGPTRWQQRTPGGTNVYEPGDPRIGGRLCPRCRGEGSIRIFILEVDRCPMCGGIGRVF